MGFEIHEVVNGIDRLIDAKLAAAAAAAKGDEPQKAERLAAVSAGQGGPGAGAWKRPSPRPGAWTSDPRGRAPDCRGLRLPRPRKLAWFIFLVLAAVSAWRGRMTARSRPRGPRRGQDAEDDVERHLPVAEHRRSPSRPGRRN